MRIRKRLAGIPKQYITVVSNAAGRTALTPVDGDLCLQRDNDTLYEWDQPTTSWLAIAGATAVLSSTETNTTKSTISNNSISTNVKLSSNAPSAANVAVLNSANADGIQGQVAKTDIQSAAFAAMQNSPSVNFVQSGGNLKANVNLSAAAADAGYTLVGLSIQTDGLRTQLNNSTLYGLFSSANSAITYSNGTFTFNAGNVSHGSLANLTTADDHTQYALLAGRAGGQALSGGKAASDSLTLSSTAHATKGSILFGSSRYDEANNRLGVGNTPAVELDITGAMALRHGADNASTGTLADVPTTSISLLRFTGASAINSLAGGVDGKLLIIINKSASALTVNNLTGTAANQIYTGSGAPVIMQANAALFLVYDSVASKWCVVGGAGGGGLVVVATTPQAAGSTIAVGPSQRIVNYVQGNGGAVVLSTTTPIQAGTIDGSELTITGRSDTNTVTIPNSGTVKQNGQVTLGNGDTISYVWDATGAVWIEQGRNH